jgi:cephalosporin hydroxylase
MRYFARIEPLVDIRSAPLHDLVKISRPSRILEIGSWQGYSAVQFLTAARALGLDSEINRVDTSLGSIEHWLDKKPDSEWSFESLNVIDGEPPIY